MISEADVRLLFPRATWFWTIPVDKFVVESEAVYELFQLLLNLELSILPLGEIRVEDVGRIHRLAIHLCVLRDKLRSRNGRGRGEGTGTAASLCDWICGMSSGRVALKRVAGALVLNYPVAIHVCY